MARPLGRHARRARPRRAPRARARGSGGSGGRVRRRYTRLRRRPLRMRRRRARAPRHSPCGRHVPDRDSTGRRRRRAVSCGSRRVVARASGGGRVRRPRTPGRRLGRRRSRPSLASAVEPRPPAGRGGPRRPAADAPPVVLELWLEAADDPTLALPARCSRPVRTRCSASCGTATRAARSIAGSRRSSRSSRMRGSRSTGDPPTHVELDADQVRAFLRDAMPRLEELGVPLRLPRDWVSSSSRVRVNLVATGSHGGVERAPDTRRDRLVRLAARDRRRRAERGGAAGAGGREGAVDPAARQVARAPCERGRACAPLPRAPRPLRRGRRARPRRRRASRRTRPGSSSARSGSTRPSTTSSRARTSGGSGRCPTPAGMRHDLFPFQERGHGWLRLLGDLRRRRDPRRRHGAREDGPGDRDVRLRAGGRRRGRRADARRQPDERRRSSGRARSPASLPGCASTSTTGRRASRATRSSRPRGRSDVVVTSYDVATRDVELLSRVDVGPAAARRGAGREEPADEAASRAAPDPAAAGARAHGHADREPARRAVGDHGPRQPRAARLARGVRALVRPPDRGAAGRAWRSSGSARSSGRSCSAGRRTPPRSISSSRRSRSQRCRAT